MFLLFQFYSLFFSLVMPDLLSLKSYTIIALATSGGQTGYILIFVPRTKYWVLRKKLTVLSLVCSIMSTLTIILRIISMRFPLVRNIENKDKNCSLLTTFLNAISTLFLDFNKTLAYVSRKMYFFFALRLFSSREK